METTATEIDMSSLKSALTTSSLSQQVYKHSHFKYLKKPRNLFFKKKKVKFGKEKLNVTAVKEKLCNYLQRLENLKGFRLLDII
jgi:hypothetical protein